VSPGPAAPRVIRVAAVKGPGRLARHLGDGAAQFSVWVVLDGGGSALLTLDGTAAVLLVAEIMDPLMEAAPLPATGRREAPAAVRQARREALEAAGRLLTAMEESGMIPRRNAPAP